MRGKQAKQVCEQLALRITPACAGKTEFNVSPEFFKGDHPRVCGENGAVPFVQGIFAGSPPRVRGKQIFFKNCLTE